MKMLNGTELKASIVLRAMVEGLKKSMEDDKFEIRMSTFGAVDRGTCFGCAATVALVQMFGQGRSASELMLEQVDGENCEGRYVTANLSESLRSGGINLAKLEFAIDNARKGYVSDLILHISNRECMDFNRRWHLSAYDWWEQLPIVESTILEMTAAGY